MQYETIGKGSLSGRPADFTSVSLDFMGQLGTWAGVFPFPLDV